MPSIPLFGTGRSGYAPSGPLIVTYEYIPDSALGVNGEGDWAHSLLAPAYPGAEPTSRVRYEYAGPVEYSHSGVEFTVGTFDAFLDMDAATSGSLSLTYPDSWLEFTINVTFNYLEQGGTQVSYFAAGGSLIQPKYVNSTGGTDENVYTVPEANSYLFTTRVLSLFQSAFAGGIIYVQEDYNNYLKQFLPLALTYEFGDGTTATHTVNEYVDNDINSPTYGGGILFTLPEPKVYAPGEHISYPKVWVEDSRGQRMRPIYYDLYPTATISIGGNAVAFEYAGAVYYQAPETIVIDDTSATLTLDIWDFENEFAYYDLQAGSTALLHETDLSPTVTFPLEDHDYNVQIDFYDADTPRAYLNRNAYLFTVRVSAGHPIHSLTDPFGLTFAAIKSGNDITVIRERGAGYNSRETVYLLTGHKNPSIYMAGGARVFLLGQDSSDSIYKLYYSDDCGEVFYYMAAPFGGDTTYKKIRACGTADGGGIATAIKNGEVWLTHSWDNANWSTPVSTGITSDTAADVHQQSLAGSARLIIVVSGGTYWSNTAEGGAYSWAALT